ncbi:MAG: ABC transporter substrate-binding protein [Firmicutes bacterium]|nr:ABC transporter substrate-binding protein [Bacillota bacterium]
MERIRPGRPRRAGRLAALALGLSLVLSACGGSAKPAGSSTTPASSGSAGQGATAAASTIKIGVLHMLSGPYALYGKYGSQGIQMAVDEVNAQGGILGRKVEVKVEDENGGTSHAVSSMRDLIQNWGAQFIVGVDSSGDALALVDVAKQLKTPMIVTHAATPKITGQLWNPYVFRVTTNSRSDAWAAAYIAAKMPITKWAGINPDYEYGHSSWQDFSSKLKELRPDVQFVDEEYAPAGAQDFSSYIAKVLQSGAQGVFSVEWAGDLVTFIRQAKGFGFFDKIQAFMDPVGAAIAVARPLGKEYPNGLWVSARYYFLAHDTPANNQFVQNYYSRYHEYPDYVSHEGYKAVYMLKKAIEAAGSTQADAVIQQLEGMCIDAPEGRDCIRAQDHQMFKDLVWGRSQYSDQYGMAVMTDMQVIPAAQVTYPPENKR